MIRKLIILVALIAGGAVVSNASASEIQPSTPIEPSPIVREDREVVKPVTLTAKPGETVSAPIEVKITRYFEDGTKTTSTETSTFTIDNKTSERNSSASRSSWTYVTCSGWKYATDSGYKSAIAFRYNGSVAEYDGTRAHDYWLSSSSWRFVARSTGSPSGSGSSQFTIHDYGVLDIQNTSRSDQHHFDWTFQSNGNCSATAYTVSNY